LTTDRLSPRWLFFAAVVFLAGVFLHLPVTDFCDWLARRYGFTAYDDTVRRAAIAIGGMAFVALWLRPGRHRVAIGAAATSLLIVAAIAHRLIVVNAIETIHYPQYALVALLLVRGGASLDAAWLGATVLGAADEGYQAVALPRGAPDYFDWNDVVLNGIGAAFGILIAMALRWRVHMPAITGARWLGGVLALLSAAVFSPPVWSPFFESTPGGRWFHRLSASEAVTILALVYGLVTSVTARLNRDS
jgi:hypothetical protein